MEFMEMERQLQDNVTKRLQAILEPEDLLFDEPMKDYTTFRVGGPAKWMAAPQDEQQLRVILKICSELQVPCFILGRGSNLLVSDNGFEGVIVNLRKHFNKIEVDRDVNVDIYLRLIDDLGLDETVLIEGDENKEEKEIKADPNCHNHT